MRVRNLVGSLDILVEYPQGLDYRRIIAMHWLNGGLWPGDWIRWNPQCDVDRIRHYVVLAERPHPGRGHEGVRQAVLAAPVPDITVAGATYAGPPTLPPRPDLRDELRIFRWLKDDL